MRKSIVTSSVRDLTNISAKNSFSYDMIVFSHLRWDFVYQRPQHIISRMSEKYSVLFVEEPIGFNPSEEGTATIIEINSNLRVLKPKVKSISDISKTVLAHVKSSSVEMGWFYSAAFSPLLNDIKFDKVIYDCMDELSLFKGASKELAAQEKYLMSEADIVFTGGKSLYESKKHAHKNVYCFPSSVEREHFQKALNGLSVPEEISRLKHPIVGYYGVIDERIDLQLLNDTAVKNPDVSFVMIGPLAKIEDQDLPKQKNIVYLGMKAYSRLPNYLKGFDIAMMPFALNDATKFISPTKTLEFMAAGKPIISTPVTDVVRDYQHCVNVVRTADEFSEAILTVSREEANQLAGVYETILNKTSWTDTVKRMDYLIHFSE
jgi:glycosyltransferase involved in cell wall biosynthesis